MQAFIPWANTHLDGWLPSTVGQDSTVGVSLLIASVILALWFLVLCRLGVRDGRFRIHVSFQKQHYIQAFCHFCIYVYLGLYWDGVPNYAPLIAAQIGFAYFFEMLLSWSRGRVWQFRLGPFPIVFSINFFMWFREPYFYLQLLMIAFAYLAKEYLTWTWEGRRRHIFNPSGIVLTVVGLILLCTGTITKFTYGHDLTSSFYLPPNLYEVVFLLGLIVMFTFGTTLVTLGSFVALWVLFGVPDLIERPVDVYVLLGLTFLLTDPSTSPRNNAGKFLFGLAYGGLIFVTYVILRLIDEPAYFDKVFPVPILNLLAPRFQILGERLERVLQRSWLPPLRHDWAVYLAVYVGTFCAAMFSFKVGREDFVSPLPPPSFRQERKSVQMSELELRNAAAKLIYPEAFEPFGFRQEIAHFHELRYFEPRTAQEHDSYGKVLFAQGLAERAVAHFRQALAIDPSCSAAHLHLGNALVVDEKLDAALDHLRQAVTLSPDDSNSHFYLGLALGMYGHSEQGIHHLERAVKLNPANSRAYFQLGHALILSGRPDDAIPHLRQALALRPRHREARQWLDRLEVLQLQNLALPDQRKG